MLGQLNVFGALSVWAALVGGVVLAFSDAAGSDALGVIGALLLAVGVLGFFTAGIRRARHEGIEVGSALAQSGRDALRLAWYVFKGA